MLTKKKRKILTPALEELFTLEVPSFNPATVVEYYGIVNYATTERVLGNLKTLLVARPTETPTLLVTSAGGPTGTAMSFYDAIRSIFKVDITTIGAGDVDSSGILVFLTGKTRYVTPHTTALLHPAGRTFEGGNRLTAVELRAMAREDALKDEQYAEVVATNSHGKLSPDAVLALMHAHTVLTADDLIRYGLADAMLA